MKRPCYAQTKKRVEQVGRKQPMKRSTTGDIQHQSTAIPPLPCLDYVLRTVAHRAVCTSRCMNRPRRDQKSPPPPWPRDRGEDVKQRSVNRAVPERDASLPQAPWSRTALCSACARSSAAVTRSHCSSRSRSCRASAPARSSSPASRARSSSTAPCGVETEQDGGVAGGGGVDRACPSTRRHQSRP
jgi:hypothetical protein